MERYALYRSSANIAFSWSNSRQQTHSISFSEAFQCNTKVTCSQPAIAISKETYNYLGVTTGTTGLLFSMTDRQMHSIALSRYISRWHMMLFFVYCVHVHVKYYSMPLTTLQHVKHNSNANRLCNCRHPNSLLLSCTCDVGGGVYLSVPYWPSCCILLT